MLKIAIEKLMCRENLDTATCIKIMNEILDKPINSSQVAAFLALLRAKPETGEELAGILVSLQQKMISVDTQHKVLDIVGTGGDGANTINISTGSAILAASCGIKIAKHGNRAVSSKSGSADVLEALGIGIHLSPQKISDCIDKIGIGFCFAPNFHPVLVELSALRKQLSIATTINIAAPLLNPTQPAHFLFGVFSESLLPVIVKAIQQINHERSLIVHSCGLDELSCAGVATVIEVTPTASQSFLIDPVKLGLARCELSDLQGGDASANAQLLVETFSGKHKGIADTLILNAAAALYLYGLYPSIVEGLPHARENLYNGTAQKLLNNWIEFSHDELP